MKIVETLFKPFRWFWNLSWIKKVLLFILFGGIGTWYWISSQSELPVQVSEVRSGELTDSISASGEIDAKQRVSLVFQTGGKLSWVGVQKGDEVKKGQLVASLDKTQLQSTLKKYLNSYEKERTEFDDTSESADDVTLTETIARLKKRAQIDLDQTVIDVEIQNEVLRLASLYTPIAGVVIKAEPEFAGVNVGPTNSAYEIVNPDTVFFKADVNEVDITKVKVGTPVTLELDAYEGNTIQSKITDISFSSKTTSTGGTAYEVRIELPENTDYKYRLGMNGDADFILSSKNDVLLIPQTALVENNDTYFAWIINEGKAYKKEVKIGISSIDEVEIIEGLSKGDSVIVRPPSTLTEGTKVKKAIS